jgi:hypothetical protein
MAHDIDLVVVFPQCGQVIEMLSGSAIGIAPCPVKLMLSLLVQLALIVNCTSGQVLISRSNFHWEQQRIFNWRPVGA